MDNAEDQDNLYSKLYDSESDAYQSLYDKSVGGSQFEILPIVNNKGGKWFTYRGLMDFFHMGDSSQFMDLVRLVTKYFKNYMNNGTAVTDIHTLLPLPTRFHRQKHQ